MAPSPPLLCRSVSFRSSGRTGARLAARRLERQCSAAPDPIRPSIRPTMSIRSPTPRSRRRSLPNRIDQLFLSSFDPLRRHQLIWARPPRCPVAFPLECDDRGELTGLLRDSHDEHPPALVRHQFDPAVLGASFLCSVTGNEVGLAKAMRAHAAFRYAMIREVMHHGN